MVDVKITSNVDEVLTDVVNGMTPELAKGVLKAATFAGGAIAEEINTSFDGGSGNLARSFLPARSVRTGAGVGAAALSDLPYARIHDEGGTITPKNRYLAIPLSGDAKHRWPRDWPSGQLFFVEAKSTRNKLLVERMGKGKIKPHYLLRESVRIRAKGYVQAALEASQDDITEIIDEAMQAHIDRVDE